MVSSDFITAHKFVARWEGGLVDDPHDPGGITKWGVSLRAIIAYGMDFNNDGVVNRKDILQMTPEQSELFFYKKYWIGAVCPRLPLALAQVHYDCAVNQGVYRAATILQKVVGSKADGIIGPKTLAAMEAAWARHKDWLLVEYCVHRALHYSSLANMVRYGRGWFRRLFDVHRAAQQLYFERSSK